MTLMVPLGNITFTLPFVPEHASLQVTDIIGLILICTGLGFYRFAADLVESYYGEGDGGAYSTLSAEDLRDSKTILSPFLKEERDHSNQLSLQAVPEDDVDVDVDETDAL